MISSGAHLSNFRKSAKPEEYQIYFCWASCDLCNRETILQFISQTTQIIRNYVVLLIFKILSWVYLSGCQQETDGTFNLGKL